MAKRLLLGIGNPFLKDDRAGLEVVARARARGCPWDTEELYTVGLELLDKICGYDEVIIVDAAQWGTPPGTILELTGKDLRDPLLSTANTHAMTLGHTLEVGYQIFPEEMPQELRVILVQIAEIDTFSDQFSPAVERAVEEVVQRLERIWLRR